MLGGALGLQAEAPLSTIFASSQEVCVAAELIMSQSQALPSQSLLRGV